MFSFNPFGNSKTTGFWVGAPENSATPYIDAIGSYENPDGSTREIRIAVKGGISAVAKQDQPGRPVHLDLRRPDGSYHPAASDPELRREIIDELREFSDNE
jgi:hypothetical protein